QLRRQRQMCIRDSHEIIGLTVVDEDDKEIGKITEILSPGANDVWVVKRKGQKDALIPYIESVSYTHLTLPTK
ncbi:PRC-barrel domain-containing protein, partial [Enterococcus sp. S181_ASV_20]|nr:PRC-barrel domain-containing protein [Enterococcus sp. S181_ASV_20]